MEISDISALIADEMKKVEAEFERNLSSEVELIPVIGRYVLSGGGKRIRPLLLILSARVAGYTGESMVPLAAIMEFIHTATLLHDDVVDSADIRRGRDSANKVWGNEASVLVGDYLFSKSFSLMTTHGDMRILRAVSDATTQMAEGEVLQLINTCDVDILEEEYLEVVVSKTAVLLAVACEVGGMLGGLDDELVGELRAFGMELGIAFQLIDDCLDYVADQEEFGKTVGSDLEEGKITMPLIQVLKRCDAVERERMIEIVEEEELTDEGLSFVMGLIDKYDGIGGSRQRALDRVEAAKSHLTCFEDSLEKQALMKLADYVVVRKL